MVGCREIGREILVGFPDTKVSAVLGMRSEDDTVRRRSFDALARAYWRPVYAHVRARWNRPVEEAQDLTQGFFLSVLERDALAAYDPAKARFRTYLRVCLDGFLANEDKAAHRLKRGGEASFVPLDVEEAESRLRAREGSPEETFDREWTRSLLELGVARLREELVARGKPIHLEVFERHDLSDEDARPSYKDLAAAMSLPVTQVNNHLAFARRELRRILLELLREITASDDEFRAEARSLLGADPEERC
jgi:RNA polymerase sigma factor (sigma-70 family)